MATKIVKLSTCILICIIVGVLSFIAGSETKSFWDDPCDGCCSDCKKDLADALTKLDRAYVISSAKPDTTEISLKVAETLMKDFEASDFAKIKYQGMNLHLTHLEHMIRYHIDLGSTAHGGFRVYNGLILPSDGSPPTFSDIRQLIVPLSIDGKVIMPSDKIMSFEPNVKFELPCPKRCD
jgi:hypothetical protein